MEKTKAFSEFNLLSFQRIIIIRFEKSFSVIYFPIIFNTYTISEILRYIIYKGDVLNAIGYVLTCARNACTYNEFNEGKFK